MHQKYIVIKQIGCEDSKAYAVGEIKDRNILIHHWYETEDAARADAHRLLFGIEE